MKTFYLFLALLMSGAAPGWAAGIDPGLPGNGWFLGYDSGNVSTTIDTNSNSSSFAALIPGNPNAVAEVITAEIQALATGLRDDPKLIFDYVHDHIRYVHYFGSKKGAALTLLEQSGNDFDQCALLVATLRAAGKTNVSYQFGVIYLPYESVNHQDYRHWVGTTLTNSDWEQTKPLISSINNTRGFPWTANFSGDSNTTLLHHTWVNLQLGTTNYTLDPSFKVSEPFTGANLSTAIGMSAGTLWTNAAGTATPDYVQNLNEAALRSTLQGYTSNLLTTLKSSHPNASVQEIMGGKTIISSSSQTLGSSLPWNTYVPTTNFAISTWTYIPSNLMTTLTIGLPGTNQQIFMPNLRGDRLSLTFTTGGLAQLWQQDTPLLSLQTTGTSNTLQVALNIDQPFFTFDSTSGNYTSNGFAHAYTTNTYQRTNSSYALLYAFEATPRALYRRQQQLDTYRAQGFSDTSTQVQTETLNVMGMSWMVQTAMAEGLLTSQQSLLTCYHHRLGRMAQEGGRGYYVDVYSQLDALIPPGGTNVLDLAQRDKTFQSAQFFASAFEHGLIQQLEGTNLPAASTVKILQLANTNSLKSFLTTSTNWASGTNVSSQLTNYDITSFTTTYINPGFTLLLPQDGSIQLAGANSWRGAGYVGALVSPGRNFITMTISGRYNGAYSAFANAQPSIPTVAQNSSAQSDFINPQSSLLPTSGQTAGDPVNVADGTFSFSHIDLTLGHSEPRGLLLSRIYSSGRRFYNTAGMANGWLHNYAVNLNEVAAPLPGLGTTTPAQMASMLVASYAAAAIYTNSPANPKNWLTMALIAKWGIDQLINNGVSINLGSDTIQFIKQPDGSFAPPANCTYTLSKVSGNYALQERHGNTFNFDANNRLATIVDQYNKTLTLTYNTSNWVLTATDWTNNTFTYTYSGSPSRLTSVSDSTGRSNTYSYATTYSTQGDLTAVTDAEGQTCHYTYDTNHQILLVQNNLNQLVTSNVFDSFGRVVLQASQADPNQTWQFFWGGYANTIVDPLGGQQQYYFDDKTRQIGFQDALGHSSQNVYDGQDHVILTVSPLGETNQFVYDNTNNLTATIDPLGYSNQYVFDAQNNLIQTIDKRGHSSHFGYNSQYSLTAVTNQTGDVRSFVWNTTTGTLTSMSDTNGTTTFGYDTHGLVNSITYPGSLGTESFVNNALGDVLTNTNARGFVTSLQYNHRRQLTTSIGPTNRTSSITYDAVGNPLVKTDPLGYKTTNFWSATHKLLGVALPHTPQGTPTITNVYDNRDWLARSLNPLQKAITNFYDLSGRLRVITDPLLRTNSIGYDLDGHTGAITNGAGETSYQLWNIRGELTNAIDGAGKHIFHVYDEVGNQIYLTNRNGKRWQFQFDAANRLTNTITPRNFVTGVAYHGAGQIAAIQRPMGGPTKFTYDSRGRQSTSSDDVGTRSFGFDVNNNPTTVSEGGVTNIWTYDAYDRVSTYQDTAGYLIHYGYDTNGNLTTLVYPGNRTVTYAYDGLNRLTNVTDWVGRQTAFSYDLASHLTNIARPNGTMRTIGYDDAGQTTSIVERASAGGMAIAYFRMNWDNAGRPQWEYAAPTPHAYTPPTRTMSYDDDNRLWTFNSSYVTNDYNGNLTFGPLTNGTFYTYAYDLRNRLTSAGGLSYGYDPSGARTTITVGTNVTQFVNNPNAALPQVLMRINGGTTNFYIYGQGLLYEIDETASTTNVLTYHYDYRGSTIALSDSYHVTDRIEYSPYGLITYRGGTNNTPFLFNGRYGVMTESNGLLYMRSRYYNALICRFLNADPSGFSGGLNFFAYANGNPVSLIDPFGLGAQEGWSASAATWIQRNVVDPLNAFSADTPSITASTLINFYVLNSSSFINGMADLMRVGQGTADALYSAQDGWDVAIGITKDVGRAAGLASIMGGALSPLNSLGAAESATVSLAEGAGYESKTLGGTVYTGGYDPAQNALYLGDAGHPQGVFAAGGNPSAPGLAGVTVVDKGTVVLWNNASPSLPGLLTDSQRAAVQSGLQNLFPGKVIQYSSTLR